MSNSKNFFKKNSSLEPSEITLTSLDEKFLTSLMAAIEKGIPDHEFNINSLETEVGMSHSIFYRKIKSLTGQSSKEIMQNVRMKRAHRLLSDNKDVRVSEVTYMVGFTNPKCFSKCFKEKYGIAPSTFND